MNGPRVLASIPSPGSGSIDIGPLSLNAYGLMIALGVVAAVWLFGRRLEQRGVGTREDASSIGLWAVLAGVVGARLYHVVTDWERFEGQVGNAFKIWEGGLGIPGGLAFGIPVGIWVARRKGIRAADAATAAAPALPLAQAIGRWGNWFNQELFGGPTDLPWALEINDENIPAGYASGTTFHPTFLYESLWNLALFGLLLWIDRRYRPARGRLMAIYLAGYGLGRFWVEGLRIDDADVLGPFRWNQWVALAAIVAGVTYLVLTRGHAAEPALAADDRATDVDDVDDVDRVDTAAPVDDVTGDEVSNADAAHPDDEPPEPDTAVDDDEALGDEHVDVVDDDVTLDEVEMKVAEAEAETAAAEDAARMRAETGRRPTGHDDDEPSPT